jgi:hypothetical protein
MRSEQQDFAAKHTGAWEPIAKTLAVLFALVSLVGCSSTNLTRASAPASSIRTPAQAVAFLTSLNSLKINLAGNVSSDMNSCHLDETGVLKANFEELKFYEKLDHPLFPEQVVKATVRKVQYKRGQSPFFREEDFPSKKVFELQHQVELRSARYEELSSQGLDLEIRYRDEMHMPIYATAPVWVAGDYRLKFKDVAKIVTRRFPQGRGRVIFYNQSGQHMGAWFFMDDDFTQVADIEASLLVLCPNIK